MASSDDDNLSEWFNQNADDVDKKQRSVSRNVFYEKRRARVIDAISESIDGRLIDKQRAALLDQNLTRALLQSINLDRQGLGDVLPGYFELAFRKEQISDIGEESPYLAEALDDARREVKSRSIDHMLQRILRDAENKLEEWNPALNNLFEAAYEYARAHLQTEINFEYTPT